MRRLSLASATTPADLFLLRGFQFAQAWKPAGGFRIHLEPAPRGTAHRGFSLAIVALSGASVERFQRKPSTLASSRRPIRQIAAIGFRTLRARLLAQIVARGQLPEALLSARQAGFARLGCRRCIFSHSARFGLCDWKGARGVVRE